jgi:hypothetical protein
MKRFAFAAIAAALLASAPASAAARDLEGTWQNDRGGGTGLSQLEITFQGSTFLVWASAPCGRKPCDLGETTGYVLVSPGGRSPDRDAIGISAGFEARDATRQVIATSVRGDRLQVQVISSFRDGRAAVYTSETFSRSR